MERRKGFTLVETLAYVFIMSLVLAGIYTMIVYYRNVSGTEQSRLRAQQESRFLLTQLANELKDAGSILTLSHTGAFLADTPYFNGIAPLNNTNWPDGLIVASGDPDAATTLAQSTFQPSASSTIQVERTTRRDNPGVSAWNIGDTGIILNTSGYYVFRVAGIAGTTLTIRSTGVYYSGLLSTANYSDPLISPATQSGKNVTYNQNNPVIRLTAFSIYLVEERTEAGMKRPTRSLVKITDCLDVPDVLASNTVQKGIMVENLWDLQLVYAAYPDMEDPSSTVYYATSSLPWDMESSSTGSVLSNPCSSATASTCVDFLDSIRTKQLKEVILYAVELTDEYAEKGGRVLRVPALGDHAAYDLPKGNFTFKLFTLRVEPRNYNIIL